MPCLLPGCVKMASAVFPVPSHVPSHPSLQHQRSGGVCGEPSQCTRGGPNPAPSPLSGAPAHPLYHTSPVSFVWLWQVLWGSSLCGVCLVDGMWGGCVCLCVSWWYVRMMCVCLLLLLLLHPKTHLWPSLHPWQAAQGPHSAGGGGWGAGWGRRLHSNRCGQHQRG